MLENLFHRVASLRRQLRLAQRHLRYGLPGWPYDRRAARAEALATLFHIVNTHLRTLGGDYWITYGTLLGWHREGTILAHDTDVDFGAPVDRYEEIRASRHRLPDEFTLRDTSHRHGGPKLCIDYRGWEADIYFFSEDARQLRVHLRSDVLSDSLPLPREWIFPTESVLFLGATTSVPARPLPYLEHMYGYIGRDAVRDPVTGYFRPRS